MTYTDSQKREALAWAEENPKQHAPKFARVLASALRLAESELAEARRAEKENYDSWQVLGAEVVRLKAELSALRAEKGAVIAERDRRGAELEDMIIAHSKMVRRAEAAEAAEAKVALAVRELKSICMNPSNAVALGRSALKRIAALRETEGGAR